MTFTTADDTVAINQLHALINEVSAHAGKDIQAEHARYLVEHARNVIKFVPA